MDAYDQDERGIVGIWLARMKEEEAFQGGQFSTKRSEDSSLVHSIQLE